LPVPRSTYAELAFWPTINFCYTPKSLREAEEVHRQAREPDKTKRLVTVLKKQLGHRMAFAVESGKIALSGAAGATIPLHFIEKELEARATRQDFDETISQEIMRLRLSVWNCVALAGVDTADINTVFMTGGSSRVPAIENLMREEFPDADIRRSDDFLSVAVGLTLQAQSRYG
jgi:hypothetical chaperone protein